MSSGAHHDGAGVEPDAHGKHGAVRTPGRRHLHEPERRPRGELGRVVVGLRPAEVDQYPVAEILRHVASVAGDHLARARPIRPQHVRPVLGIEPRRELHRADEVAEEDRQLAALASEPEVGRGCGRRGRSGLGRSIGVRRRRPALGAELRGGRQIRLAARAAEREGPPAFEAEPPPGGIRMATEGARHRVAHALPTTPPRRPLTYHHFTREPAPGVMCSR